MDVKTGKADNTEKAFKAVNAIDSSESHQVKKVEYRSGIAGYVVIK